MVELRVVLAYLTRTFDIRPAYNEWDIRYPKQGIKLYRGERAYQIQKGAGNPVDGYPCRVYLAKRE